MAEALLPSVKHLCATLQKPLIQKKAFIAALSIFRAAPQTVGDGWLEILQRAFKTNDVSIVRNSARLAPPTSNTSFISLQILAGLNFAIGLAQGGAAQSLAPLVDTVLEMVARVLIGALPVPFFSVSGFRSPICFGLHFLPRAITVVAVSCAPVSSALSSSKGSATCINSDRHY